MPAICILGGGYAGVRVARELTARLDRSWSITLIDRGDCHQLITRLPELVAGKIEPGDACIPFRRLLARRINHVKAEVLTVELASRGVETSQGAFRPDVLVIAFGTAPDFLGIPGAPTHCLTVKSVRDAVHLRDTLDDLRSTRQLTRVVIVGAGYTGTEVSGELSAPEYRVPGARGLGRIEVRIVAEDARLLPQAGPRVSAAVERVLVARKVPLHLGQPVRRVDESGVWTDSGSHFEADLVVWAGQTRMSVDVPASRGLDIPAAKLAVDPYLRVKGHDSVFACADDAETLACA